MGRDPVRISPAEWAGILGVEMPADWPVSITGVQCDSRRVRPGDLFVAIPGYAGDGHRFVKDAVRRGASGVILEHADSSLLSVPSVVVPSCRMALADACREFYGRPDEDLTLIGVTGTNGKTSVTRFTRQLLEAVGHPSGSLGTVGASFAGRELPGGRTTPSGPELHRLLAEMVRARCTHAVMEVSSHALDQKRVHGLHFDTVVFTNLSQDHLDYHPDMQSYFEAKASLFAMPGVHTRIVGEDSWSEEIASRYEGEVIRCGLGTSCDVRADVVESTLERTRARVVSPWGTGELTIPLPGIHNLRNVLQALSAAGSAGAEFTELLGAAEALEAAPGRFENIPSAIGSVFVDYAHTPDALDQVLKLAKPLTSGKLHVVFGCGGDRDRTKRPLMVEAAAHTADEMTFTLDNPRTEDPDQIFADMKKGLKPGDEVRTEKDRATAIRSAIFALEEGDTLIVAGKGHEAVQEQQGVQIPFDDREVARRMIKERDAALGRVR